MTAPIDTQRQEPSAGFTAALPEMAPRQPSGGVRGVWGEEPERFSEGRRWPLDWLLPDLMQQKKGKKTKLLLTSHIVGIIMKIERRR